jgi:hypothetical protein
MVGVGGAHLCLGVEACDVWVMFSSSRIVVQRKFSGWVGLAFGMSGEICDSTWYCDHQQAGYADDQGGAHTGHLSVSVLCLLVSSSVPDTWYVSLKHTGYPYKTRGERTLVT